MALVRIVRNLEVISSAGVTLRMANDSVYGQLKKEEMCACDENTKLPQWGLHTDEIVRARQGTVSYSSSS